MSDEQRDCEHGHRRGKCPHCDLIDAERELAEARKERDALKARLAVADQAVVDLTVEADQLRERLALAPLCDLHGQNKGGVRSGCPYCAIVKLTAALSRIDYLCGPPNEMECSGYDFHYNEDAVVQHVQARLTKMRPSEEAVKAADYIINGRLLRTSAQEKTMSRDILRIEREWKEG